MKMVAGEPSGIPKKAIVPLPPYPQKWVTPNAKMIANRWALPVIEGSTMVAATVMVTVASITDKILLLVAFQQLQLQLIQITRL